MKKWLKFEKKLRSFSPLFQKVTKNGEKIKSLAGLVCTLNALEGILKYLFWCLCAYQQDIIHILYMFVEMK